VRRLFRVRADGGAPVLAERREDRFRAAEVPPALEELAGTIFEADEPGRDLGPTDEMEVLVPTDPSKIVCIGRNYREHAEELDNPVPDEPLMFLKPPSSLVADGGSIRLPPQSDEVHHEAELACIIGERCAQRSPDRASEAVAAYTCANDVTARDLQRADKTFTRGKGFDTFCPAGPGLVVADGLELEGREISCRVDGTERQSGTFDALIVPITRLVSFVSDVMTLEPGDLLLTGTPPGVGPIEAGQRVEIDIDGIGRLSNPVEERGGRSER